MKVINKCSYFLFCCIYNIILVEGRLFLKSLNFLSNVYITNEAANCISDIMSSMNLVDRFIEFFDYSINKISPIYWMGELIT